MMFALISLVTVLAGYFLGRWSLAQELGHDIHLGNLALETCNLWAMWSQSQDEDERYNLVRQIQENHKHIYDDIVANMKGSNG